MACIGLQFHTCLEPSLVGVDSEVSNEEDVDIDLSNTEEVVDAGTSVDIGFNVAVSEDVEAIEENKDVSDAKVMDVLMTSVDVAPDVNEVASTEATVVSFDGTAAEDVDADSEKVKADIVPIGENNVDIGASVDVEIYDGAVGIDEETDELVNDVKNVATSEDAVKGTVDVVSCVDVDLKAAVVYADVSVGYDEIAAVDVNIEAVVNVVANSVELEAGIIDGDVGVTAGNMDV
jgi:hypothetical protein